MIKLPFEPNIWIKGEINDITIVGRTYIYQKEELVACVDENSYLYEIEFSLINNVRKVIFVKPEEMLRKSVEFDTKNSTKNSSKLSDDTLEDLYEKAKKDIVTPKSINDAKKIINPNNPFFYISVN